MLAVFRELCGDSHASLKWARKEEKNCLGVKSHNCIGHLKDIGFPPNTLSVEYKGKVGNEAAIVF